MLAAHALLGLRDPSVSGLGYSLVAGPTNRHFWTEYGHLHCCVFRLSVNQITDTGVKVLCEELTKYKIVTFLG